MTGAPSYGHESDGRRLQRLVARERAGARRRGRVGRDRVVAGGALRPRGQMSRGRRSASLATAGRHVDRQRPSAPATEVHVVGTDSPADWTNESGAQKPACPLVLCTTRSSDCIRRGDERDGTQCAPAHAGEHAGNCVGSISGGPVYGQVGPPPPSLPRAPPASPPQMRLRDAARAGGRVRERVQAGHAELARPARPPA